MSNDATRLRSYNQTGAAGSEVKLRAPVGYVWNIQQIIVSTDAAADAGDMAVVYVGQTKFDSIMAAGSLVALAAGSVVTFTLNGAAEVQENSIIATVESGAGRVSLTVYVEENLISQVRIPDRAPGMSMALMLADQ